MPIAFKNPPLIEIIAELRWTVAGVAEGMLPANLAQMPLPVPDPGNSEMQAMNFASKVGGHGFTVIERVIPPGFPFLMGQPAYRFRRSTNESSGSPLFQLGPGVFTANMVPPYKSWETFRPFVDLGVGCLLATRQGKEDQPALTSLRLRYIDAFGDEYRKGESLVGFISDTLGFHFQLPEALERVCSVPSGIVPSLNFQIPTEQGTLEVKVGEGWVRNKRTLVMDTTAVCSGPISSDKRELLAKLDQAHTVIHSSFVDLTKKLHDVMQKEG